MDQSDKETAWQGTGSQSALVRESRRRDPARFTGREWASKLLSAYITDINNVRSGQIPLRGLKKYVTLAWWSLCAERQARDLLAFRLIHDFDQADVLAAWLIATARFVPGRRKLAQKIAATTFVDGYLSPGSRLLPHQRAIACITYAKAVMLEKPVAGSVEEKEVELKLRQAMQLESAIFQEQGVQPLRQFVRVLKDMGAIELQLGDIDSARESLAYASTLACGKADTESQAAQIRKLIEQLPRA